MHFTRSVNPARQQNGQNTDMTTPTCCPACREPMGDKVFPRLPLGEVAVDLCFGCQAIWFDQFESLQLAPTGVLTLFRMIHERRDDPRQPWPATLDCPRCGDQLMQGFDLSKNGRFSYHRCLQGHGRFTPFSSFMIEKGFVRQLNGAEIAELAKKVQIVRCSGCGAPVDIRQDTVCSHCHAPIAILDPQAVKEALAKYERPTLQTGQIPAAAVADLLIANERYKSEMVRERQIHRFDAIDSGADLTDLVVGGIELLGDLLSD